MLWLSPFKGDCACPANRWISRRRAWLSTKVFPDLSASTDVISVRERWRDMMPDRSGQKLNYSPGTPDCLLLPELRVTNLDSLHVGSQGRCQPQAWSACPWPCHLAPHLQQQPQSNPKHDRAHWQASHWHASPQWQASHWHVSPPACCGSSASPSRCPGNPSTNHPRLLDIC